MRGPLSAIGSFLIDTLETVVIALSVFVLIYLLVFQPHEIKGESMDGIAGFHDGQYILTDKLTYKFRDPRRGDVIVFKYPLNTSYDYIKRIIALPGESIMLKNGQIIIKNKQYPNGKILDESDYLDDSVKTTGKAFLKEGLEVKVPKDEYFVMGDNREHSSDSRTWGFVKKEDIIGRSFFRYWPPNEVGLVKHPKLQ